MIYTKSTNTDWSGDINRRGFRSVRGWSYTKITIAQSFFKLGAPNFEWYFIYTKRTNTDKSMMSVRR